MPHGRPSRASIGAAPEEVAVITSVSQGVSSLVSALPLEPGRNRIVISEFEFPTVGQIAHAQELRGAEVVHVRPDARRSDPARALRGGDRRANGARLLHRDLVPHGLSARRRRGRASRARAGRALSRGQLPGGRRDPARRRRTRSRPAHGGHGEVPPRVGRSRVHVRAPRLARAPSADPDGLVRGRGHLPDGHLRLLTRTGCAALRCGNASGAEHLRRDRRDGDRRRGGRGGDRAARAGARRPAAGGARRAGSYRRHPARRTASTARSSASPRPTRAHWSTLCRTSRIVTSERDANLRISLHLYNVEEDIDRILEGLAARPELLA